MAQSRKTIESVWAAKGNLPDSAIVATSDGKYPALDGSLITGIAGSGDMNASVYDPNTVAADAFARANHTGTQTASTISDFDTEVSNNTTVAANTSSISLKAPINNPAFTGIGTIGAYNILTDQSIGLDIQAHSSILDATDASFTTAQAAEIAANTLKTGITTAQAADIVTNNAKVGITPTQASDITANNAKVTNATHTGDVTGDGVLTIADDAVDIPMLSATGTANGTTFLRGDNVWATPAGGSGDVATDAIWDAKGDLAGGTGADTAARLAVGTNGQVLTADSAEATGLKWAAAGGASATETTEGIVQLASDADSFNAFNGDVLTTAQSIRAQTLRNSGSFTNLETQTGTTGTGSWTSSTARMSVSATGDEVIVVPKNNGSLYNEIIGRKINFSRPGSVRFNFSLQNANTLGTDNVFRLSVGKMANQIGSTGAPSSGDYLGFSKTGVAGNWTLESCKSSTLVTDASTVATMAAFGYYALSVIWDGAGNVELWFYDYLSAPEDWALIAESTDGPTGETTGKIINLELVGGATGNTTDALQIGVVHYIL